MSGYIRLTLGAGLTGAAAAWLCGPAAARACAVCGGDKGSALVQGAQNGVLVMLIITYVVLLGMAGLALAWFIRARRRAMPSAASFGAPLPGPRA